MHELSIAQALVEQVADVLAKEGAVRATDVTVTVGALSGVNPEALLFAFPMAVQDTGIGTPRLRIDTVPAKVLCKGCGQSCEPDPPFLVCPACGGIDVEVESGRELLLTAVELEVAEGDARPATG